MEFLAPFNHQVKYCICPNKPRPELKQLFFGATGFLATGFKQAVCNWLVANTEFFQREGLRACGDAHQDEKETLAAFQKKHWQLSSETRS